MDYYVLEAVGLVLAAVFCFLMLVVHELRSQ